MEYNGLAWEYAMMDDQQEVNRYGLNLPTDVPYVMVVESDPHIAETLQEVIKKELRLGVIFAATAKVALQLTSVLRPQLFLINEHLLDGDGVSLADQLHQRRGFEQILVILLSTDVERCKRRVKNPHMICIDLPFELDDLISVIFQFLPQQERERS